MDNNMDFDDQIINSINVGPDLVPSSNGWLDLAEVFTFTIFFRPHRSLVPNTLTAGCYVYIVTFAYIVDTVKEPRAKNDF